MSPNASGDEQRPVRRPDINRLLIHIFIGLFCACICLALALYRVPLTAVAAALAGASPAWLGAAVAAYTVNLVLRAWRWQAILRPVAVVPYAVVARALIVGYGLNAIMPLRLGEFFRAEFLKKLCSLRRAPALISIVVERLLDGLTVVVCLAGGLLLTIGEHEQAYALLRYLALVGGGLFMIILAILVCLGRTNELPRVSARFPTLTERLNAATGMLQILRSRRIIWITVLTLIVYIPDSLSLWCVVRAVGFQLSLQNILVLVGTASLSTLVPSGPAFMGSLQLAYVLALNFAGGQPATGIAAAMIAQFILFLPTAIVAMVVLAQGSGSLLRSAITRRGVSAV